MTAADQVEGLPDRATLTARWQDVMGSSPPPRLSRHRLYRGIRYAEQVAADPELQRLDRQVSRRLKQLARQPKSKSRSVPVGTRLLREWHGKTHEVLVTDQGYLYRGTTYRSLTAIAGVITGTQWSGPNFFGLK